jgi:hypothetical protein
MDSPNPQSAAEAISKCHAHPGGMPDNSPAFQSRASINYAFGTGSGETREFVKATTGRPALPGLMARRALRESLMRLGRVSPAGNFLGIILDRKSRVWFHKIW